MMRSLYAGVSGLKTHQTKMDVIGNNIANVNTVAYKSASITFSELMYQTTQSASGPNAATGTAGTNPKQIGLGVTSGAISTSIETAGATQTTGNPFDLRITGDAFFMVSNGNGMNYTRDGSFYVDAAGNLAMQSTGYNVMGWGVDENGDIKKGEVVPLRVMSAENMTYPAESTSKAYLSGIIDKLDEDVTSSSGKTVNLTFYDNLGYQYTAKYNIKVLNADTGEYSLSLSDVLNEDNESVMDTYPNIGIGDVTNYTYTGAAVAPLPTTLNGMTFAGGTFTVTADGSTITTADLYDAATGFDTEKLDKIAAAYGYSTTDFLNLTFANGTGTITMEDMLKDPTTNATLLNGALAGTSNVTGIQTTVLKYSTKDGAFVGINGTTNKSFTLSMGGYANFSDIVTDLSTTSNVNNSGTSTIAGTKGDTDGYGTGRKLGEMIGVSIENSGLIYASYSNGQKRILGQIAVAEFANASGLEKEGDNLYSSTTNSGDAAIGDITTNGGKITSGVLEMSNVDLSSEFTEMITTQRGFQANSRIITVSDTLLEELVNLKR